MHAFIMRKKIYSIKAMRSKMSTKRSIILELLTTRVLKMLLKESVFTIWKIGIAVIKCLGHQVNLTLTVISS